MNNKKQVVFLDFDGVMVTSRYNAMLSERGLPWTDCYGALFDPVCVENLRQIINETKADIVVTSTWKMDLRLEGVQAMWEERHLPGVLIGVTPNVDILCRGNEIDAWLNNQENVSRYVIIDDAPFTNFFTESQQEHLFIVDEKVGLEEETTLKIIEYLNEHTYN